MNNRQALSATCVLCVEMTVLSGCGKVDKLIGGGGLRPASVPADDGK